MAALQYSFEDVNEILVLRDQITVQRDISRAALSEHIEYGTPIVPVIVENLGTSVASLRKYSEFFDTDAKQLGDIHKTLEAHLKDPNLRLKTAQRGPVPPADYPTTQVRTTRQPVGDGQLAEV